MITDAALPWILLAGCLIATGIGGLAAVALLHARVRLAAEDCEPDPLGDAYDRSPLAAWAIDRHGAVLPHGWREFNEYGNTCHFPGCTRNEDEHHEERA